MDPKAYWVGFNNIKGIGAVRTRAILDHFGDLGSAWNASIESFAELGIPAKTLENIPLTRNQIDLERIWGNLVTKGINLITWEDEITSSSGLTPDKVSAALTILELKGMVRQVEGSSYMVIREAMEKYDA